MKPPFKPSSRMMITSAIIFYVSTALGQPTSPVTLETAINVPCKVGRISAQQGDQVVWQGKCVNGLAEGAGVTQWSLNGKPTFRYEGTFSKGLLEGKGSMTSTAGDQYEGEYMGGLRHGRGIYVNASKAKFEGNFRFNQRVTDPASVASGSPAQDNAPRQTGQTGQNTNQSSTQSVADSGKPRSSERIRVSQACASGNLNPGGYWLNVPRTEVDFKDVETSKKFLLSQTKEAIAATQCSGPGKRVYVVGFNSDSKAKRSVECEAPATLEKIVNCIDSGNFEGAYLRATSQSFSLGSGASGFVSAITVMEKQERQKRDAEKAQNEQLAAAEAARKTAADKKLVEDEARRAATEKLQTFATSNKAAGFIDDAVWKNPFKFEGKIMIVRTQLMQFTSKDRALFQGKEMAPLVVTGIEAKNFSNDDTLLLAVRVDGAEQVELLGTKLSTLKSTYLNHLTCKPKQGCSEFNNVVVNLSK